MMLILKNGYLIEPESGYEGYKDILIDGDKIVDIVDKGCGKVENLSHDSANEVIDVAGKIVTAGLVDGHVHFRDPGFTYKEDIETGARASARGGFTSVVMMGNTNPHMDNVETIKYVLEKGKETGINVYTCANVTMNMEGKEQVDMEKLLDAGAVLFTDDGKPITDEKIMEAVCKKAAALDKVVSLHEEDPKFITDNGINAGAVAEKLGIKGSPREAEISMVKRDIEIAERTGAKITVQHISAAESVDLIRQAKKRGVKVYAEATPHHFTLTEDAVLKHGTLAKMNPPLRLESDRLAIIEGLKDGTIEMIATDHAPHSKEEKEKPIKEAPSGITGIETSLLLGIREIVDKGYMTLPELLKRMTICPAKIYGLDAGSVKVGGKADLVIFDNKTEWVFDKTYSKATNTPFLGEKFPARVLYTICSGKIVYKA
jgi:dihydroorotase